MDIKSLLASFQTPQQSEGGLAQQILASRFQPEEPNYSDIGNAAAAGVAGNTYVSPQTFSDQRMKEAMSTLKAIQGNSPPAALQIANEYAKARSMGDTQRMNDISMAAKSFDKGVVLNSNGIIVPMNGYGSAVGSIEGVKSGAKEQAQKNVDLSMNPQIERANKFAGDLGEKDTLLNSMNSTLPQLENTAQQLSNLGKKATYTLGGQFRDSAVRQLGLGATDGAVAREEYTNKVRDVLFPQLRQTFGAQFTAKEGEALIGTLGDPNKSPDEKDAALRAFIDQKKQTINSLQREVGQSPNSQNFDQGMQNTAVDPRIAKARAAGYSDAEIQQYLGGKNAAP